MDFMKVFDQTFKDIKREVNLKVLKVPEIEQKVLDATDDEPWGPHGSDLSEIAHATKRFSDRQLVMTVLWTRLREFGPKWRHVYKSLTVIEYLIANGSEQVVDDIVDRKSRIAILSKFEYVEPSGKDCGINVRKKVETIMGILTDRDKIEAVREKAAANRNKYTGLSSTGITYKSSSSASSYKSSDNYGSFTSSRGSEFTGDSSKGKQDEQEKNKRINNDENARHKQGRELPQQSSMFARNYGPLTSGASKPHYEGDDEDDFDDFDPRESSKPAPANMSHNQVDLFGPNLMDDFLDPPTSTTTTVGSSGAPDVDLFADADFQSAASHQGVTTGCEDKNGVDLFNQQTSYAAEFPGKTEGPKHTSSEAFDPFSAIPLDNFDDPNLFSPFSSHKEAAEQHTTATSDLRAATADAQQPTKNAADSNPNKKQTFQVKSGIWADSLSRGLIDLNITAPTKVDLSSIGIAPGLSDGSGEKEPPAKPFPYSGTMHHMLHPGSQQPPGSFNWP